MPNDFDKILYSNQCYECRTCRVSALAASYYCDVHVRTWSMFLALFFNLLSVMPGRHGKCDGLTGWSLMTLPVAGLSFAPVIDSAGRVPSVDLVSASH